jgi:hypothetical protein
VGSPATGRPGGGGIVASRARRRRANRDRRAPLVVVDDPYSAPDPTRRDHVATRLAARSGRSAVSVADDAERARPGRRSGTCAPAASRARLTRCHSRVRASRHAQRRPVAIRDIVDRLLEEDVFSRGMPIAKLFGRGPGRRRTPRRGHDAGVAGGRMPGRAGRRRALGSQAKYLADEIRTRADDALGGSAVTSIRITVGVRETAGQKADLVPLLPVIRPRRRVRYGGRARSPRAGPSDIVGSLAPIGGRLTTV